MEFFEVVNTRKTIRKYKKTPPPIEDIKRIIDTARLAPSATNSQNWRFLAVFSEELKNQMCNAVINRYDEISQWEESIGFENKIIASKKYSVFFKNAPVVIVAVEQKKFSYTKEIFKTKGLSEDEIREVWADSSLLSMGGAIENMSLAAHALGYGTCWMCAPLVAAKDFKEMLQLEPDERVVTLLTVGEPEDGETIQPNKKSLDEILKIY